MGSRSGFTRQLKVSSQLGLRMIPLFTGRKFTGDGKAGRLESHLPTLAAWFQPSPNFSLNSFLRLREVESQSLKGHPSPQPQCPPRYLNI